MKDNKKKFRGCMLAGAAGDALGYAVEFMMRRTAAQGPWRKL